MAVGNRVNGKKEEKMIVRRTISILIMVLLGGFLSLTLLAQAPAKAEKAKAAPKGDKVDGRVHMIDKATSTITLRKGTVEKHVVYSDQTKFTKQNKPASLEDVKEGVRVICVGKFDEKNRLVATRVDVRAEKP
jgi:Cu/Ag efflux protein CusF